jgi:RNA-splicing ligase RtcB
VRIVNAKEHPKAHKDVDEVLSVADRPGLPEQVAKIG